MLRFRKSRKTVVLLAGIAVVAFVAVGAFAYLTTGSSTSATAAAGDIADSGVKINLTMTIDPGLVPGTDVPVTLSATNDSATTEGYVGTVTLAAANAVTDVSATPNPACVAYLATPTGQADFSLVPAAGIVEDVPVRVNDVVTALTGGSLQWANNLSQDQTPCLGEALSVAVTSS